MKQAFSRTMEGFIKEKNNLQDRMYEELFNIVNRQKDKIVLTLELGKENKDDIPCYVYDSGREEFVEKLCTAIGIFSGELCINPEDYDDKDDLIDEYNADESLIHQLGISGDKWVSIKGGQVLIFPTLSAICASIDQYTTPRLCDIYMDTREKMNQAIKGDIFKRLKECPISLVDLKQIWLNKLGVAELADVNLDEHDMDNELPSCISYNRLSSDIISKFNIIGFVIVEGKVQARLQDEDNEICDRDFDIIWDIEYDKLYNLLDL